MVSGAANGLSLDYAAIGKSSARGVAENVDKLCVDSLTNFLRRISVRRFSRQGFPHNNEGVRAIIAGKIDRATIIVGIDAVYDLGIARIVWRIRIILAHAALELGGLGQDARKNPIVEVDVFEIKIDAEIDDHHAGARPLTSGNPCVEHRLNGDEGW